MKPKEKLRMRKLIDRWSPSVIFLFSFMKFLQIFKGVSSKMKDRGWRTAMKAHARHEYSKFTLTVFRLNLWPKGEIAPAEETNESTFDLAAQRLMDRLTEFLRKTPQMHWQVKWTAFDASRKVKKVFDIVWTDFDKEGNLLKVRPFLDRRGVRFQRLADHEKLKLQQSLIKIYNETRHLPDITRPWILQQKLIKEVFLIFPVSSKKWKASRVYLKRMLSAAFISFEILPSKSLFEARRFADPKFIRRKHPGHGLLNILCRFQADFSEADLWFQFHHIPVDGLPMQEALTHLKKEWGVRGELKFPSLESIPKAIPEIASTQTDSQAMYHLTSFLDFQPFLSAKRDLAKKYGEEIGGEITAVSLILWGLSHHPLFREKKFMFPVDVEENPLKEEERVIGVVLIRPSLYFNSKYPDQGFVAYEREFNRRLEAAKKRQGESHAMFEIYALAAPLIYKLTQTILRKALGEFIGTVGVTMLKGSDLFMTPMSDTHADGFFAFGNFSVPTEDGGLAGAVSIRGRQEKVEAYLSVLKTVIQNFPKYF